MHIPRITDLEISQDFLQNVLSEPMINMVAIYAKVLVALDPASESQPKGMPRYTCAQSWHSRDRKWKLLGRSHGTVVTESESYCMTSPTLYPLSPLLKILKTE